MTFDRRPNSRESVSRKPANTSFVRRDRALQRAVASIPVWKRAMDVLLVTITLPVSLLLIGAVALWIRLVSRGPALFFQQRIGHGEKIFTIFKFRTMDEGIPTRDHELHVARLVESESPMVKLDELGDARMIPGARFLRSAGLDELPQIFNILRGEMSLVGPRPCIPCEYAFFTAAQRERFQVLPGLTGLWQVSGKSRTTFRQMAALDVAYARHSSIDLDLAVIVRTPMALLREMMHCFRRRFLTRGSTVEGGSMLGCGRQRFGDRP